MRKGTVKENTASKSVDWEKANQFITAETVTDSLRERYMPYAMSVIVSRALPSIDGFKPSQRKLLYQMYSMGLLNGSRTKSANIVGATMRLNPHGDSSIYDTMVRMSSGNESLLVPYVDSKGNFGKAYSRDMASAASRYTEAKLEPICEELFCDIDKNTVEFVPNYDDTTTEPTLLPATYPSILANNILGIAVGMACNICSFNLKELCETTAALIKDPNHDILSTLPAPDFVGGGQILMDRSEIPKVYSTGRGTIRVRGTYLYQKKENLIEITSIPPTTTVEAIIERIIELNKAGKLKEINDIRDETDLDGLKITIDLKRGTDVDKLMSQIFRLTPLEDSFSANFNVLIGDQPKVLGVKEILEEWISFRMECVRRRTEYLLENNKKRLHLLEGLEKILLDISKAIQIIQQTKQDSMVIQNLMAGFGIDETQAEYVAEIKLRNLNEEYILKRTADIKKLKNEIQKLEALMNSPQKIKNLIADELLKVAKEYGQPRKSVIVESTASDPVADSAEAEIDDYPVTLFITESGYVKKVTPLSLRMSAGAEQKLKEGDNIAQAIETSNGADVLFFTDKHNVFKRHVYDFPDTKISSQGVFAPPSLGLETGEHIIMTVCTKDYCGYVVFFFENGNAVRIPLAQYSTKLNRKKLVKCYSDKFKLIASFPSWAEDHRYAVYITGRKPVTVSGINIVEKSTKTSTGARVVSLKAKQKVKSVTADSLPEVSQTSLFEQNLQNS